MSNWTESNTDRIAELEDEVERLEGTSDPSGGGGNVDKEASPSRESEQVEVIDLLAQQSDKELRDNGKSKTIRVAAEIHRNLDRFSTKARAGRVVIQKHSTKKLAEAALDDTVYWEEVHRAMRYLDRNSEKYEYKEGTRHGNILVMRGTTLLERTR